MIYLLDDDLIVGALVDLIVGALVDLIVGALVDLIVGALVDLIVGALVDLDAKARPVNSVLSAMAAEQRASRTRVDRNDFMIIAICFCWLIICLQCYFARINICDVHESYFRRNRT